jgi:hypothetical protein
MGSTWSIAHLDQTIMDNRDIMPAALNTLLSSKGIFKGECEDFTHIVINSSGDGYSALYNIVHMVHPLLGQVTTQPSQRKTQSFSEHVTNYIGYFQSESCSGRKYTMHKRVVLFLSRLHPIWRDTMQRKYKQLVPQGSSSLTVFLESRQEMIGVTLTQWCIEERMELPNTKSNDPTPDRVFALDLHAHNILAIDADPTPAVIQFDDRAINATTVDRAIAHAICFVDQKARPDSAYPKCIACGLPGHTIDKCHPLINHCIAQALAAQHPEIVKRIKATCKMFPRSTRGRPSRPATIIQLIANLDLDQENSFSESPQSDSIDRVCSPDLTDP